MRKTRIGTRLLCIVGIAMTAGSVVLAQTSDPQVIADIKAQAARDNLDALFALAIIHEVGRDAPKNLPESVRLLERAAAKGHAPAKTRLGLLYQTGTGVARNDARAYTLFREAAATGDAEAQFRLGMAYAYGIGTAKNAPEARRWLAGAANQRHQEAQLALGVMLQQGVGGEKNEFAARRWLSAATTGNDPAVAKHAAPIVEQLDRRLLYSGISGEQLLLGVVAGVFAAALVADALASESAFKDHPSHPLNPRDYDDAGSTRRQKECQFRPSRGGTAIVSGKNAFPVYAGPSWACF